MRKLPLTKQEAEEVIRLWVDLAEEGEGDPNTEVPLETGLLHGHVITAPAVLERARVQEFDARTDIPGRDWSGERKKLLEKVEQHRDFMAEYVENVVAAWTEVWLGTDHRYGRDFHAFLGERIHTDFQLKNLPR